MLILPFVGAAGFLLVAGTHPPVNRTAADTLPSVVPAVPRSPADSGQVATRCRELAAARADAYGRSLPPDRMPHVAPDTTAVHMPHRVPDLSAFRMPVGRPGDAPSVRLPDGRVVSCPRR